MKVKLFSGSNRSILENEIDSFLRNNNVTDTELQLAVTNTQDIITYAVLLKYTTAIYVKRKSLK